MPLFWRLFTANTIALVVAFVVLVVARPTLTNPPREQEFGAMLIALVTLVLINAAVLGQGLGTLSELRENLVEGQPLPDDRRVPPEIREVARAYNAHVDRLEAELTAMSRSALRAQEEERGRLARDLHDEVGQNLTFLLLRLTGIRRDAPAEIADDLDAIADATRTTLEEVRSLSRQLLPGVVGDLGLKPALASLLDDSRKLGLAAQLDFPGSLSADGERDIVVYRVVQEALTNIVKHASATSVRVSVERHEDALVVTIADDGVGTSGREGTGTASMRERVRLVGGSFKREAVPGRGTTVTIEVPFAVSAVELGPPTRPIPTISLFPPPTWGN